MMATCCWLDTQSQGDEGRGSQVAVRHGEDHGPHEVGAGETNTVGLKRTRGGGGWAEHAPEDTVHP